MKKHIIVFVIGLIFIPRVSPWVGNYEYRQTFSVTNDDGSMFNGYIEHIENTWELIDNNQMRPDCNDILFTYDTDAPISFWLEGGCETYTTTFFLDISIPSSSTIQVYMYFSDPSIVSYQGVAWSDSFAFFRTVACSGGGVNVWNVWDGKFSMGSTNEDVTGTLGSPEHVHATNGQSIVTTESFGTYANFQSDTGDEAAFKLHYHEFDFVGNLGGIQNTPRYGTFAVCYASQGQHFGEIPVDAVAFFENVNDVADWTKLTTVNDENRYVRGDNALGDDFGGELKHSHYMNPIFPSDSGICIDFFGLVDEPYDHEFAIYDHVHSFDICYTDERVNEPKYVFTNVRRVNTETHFVNGMILPQYCNGPCAPPPYGWEFYAPLSGRFPRGTNSAANVGNVGGSMGHNHTFECTLEKDGMGTTHTVGGTIPPFSDELHWHNFSGTIPPQYSTPLYHTLPFIQRKTLTNQYETYLGIFEWRCFGDLNIGAVCSGHGNCTSHDICDCEEGWDGIPTVENCSIPLCYGSLGNGGCSDHGQCIVPDNCNCEAHWETSLSDNCSIPMCYGYEGNEGCSYHGRCTNFDICDCEPGWSTSLSLNCSVSNCFGEEGNRVCSSHGGCTSPDVCECENHHYFGANCNVTFCNGIFSNDSNVCSGNTYSYSCWPFEQCNCKHGYFFGCNVTRCYGIYSNEDKVCSHNGSCVFLDTCSCKSDYYGNFCNNTKCFGIWKNDTDATICSAHGECLYVDFCSCDDDYFSNICNVTICDTKYSDDEDVCSNHGNCMSPHNCSCVGGYGGDWCESMACYTIPFDDNATCSGMGVRYSTFLSQLTFHIKDCISYDVCDCHGDNLGFDCCCWMCFGTINTEDSVCGGKGTCVDTDLCRCNELNYGRRCEENILQGEFVDQNRKNIYIPYYFETSVLDRYNMGNLTFEEFNCSLLVYNWMDFLGDESFCTFEIIGFQSFSFSQGLRIRVFEEESNYGDVGNLNNLTVQIAPITGGDSVVNVFIGYNIDINGGIPVDDFSLGNLAFIFLVFPVFLCVCCCVICYFVVVVMVILFQVIRQKFRLKKLDQLDNVDLLLHEQKLEKDTSHAHVKINKKLFEIDFKDLFLDKILGSGGSEATVFRAQWKGTTVAFKAFKTRTICQDQNSFDGFEKEVSILASISHPNIIRYFGSCIKPPRIGFVMEFCENGDLNFYISSMNKRNDVIPYSMKLRWLYEISSAMLFLHSKRIIHRDLKLENVLLDTSLATKLMDFGLSKIAEITNQANQTKGVGTSIYMSPGGTYSDKCDVFSFAILTFAIICSTPRVYGKTTQFIELKVANSPSFRPKFEGHKSVPSWIQKLTVSNWDVDANKRKSFSEICELIKRKLMEYEKFGDLQKGENEMFVLLKEDGDEKSEKFLLITKSMKGLHSIIKRKWGEECKITNIESKGREITTNEDVQKLVMNDVLTVYFTKEEESNGMGFWKEKFLDVEKKLEKSMKVVKSLRGVVEEKENKISEYKRLLEKKN